MIVQTPFKVADSILKQLASESVNIEFKLPINEPTGNFFYDPWIVKKEFEGTVWESLLKVLPDKVGEARLIKLEPGQAYRSHADIDDRYHFNICGEKSFVLYTDLNIMYPQKQSNYWQDMDAGAIHSAVNTGRTDRIQLVVRKLLMNNKLIDPVEIHITLKEFRHDYRYVFDEIFSPWLNRANKEGIINSFSYTEQRVSFNVESKYLEEFKSINPLFFNITVVRS